MREERKSRLGFLIGMNLILYRFPWIFSFTHSMKVYSSPLIITNELSKCFLLGQDSLTPWVPSGNNYKVWASMVNVYRLYHHWIPPFLIRSYGFVLLWFLILDWVLPLISFSSKGRGKNSTKHSKKSWLVSVSCNLDS